MDNLLLYILSTSSFTSALLDLKGHVFLLSLNVNLKSLTSEAFFEIVLVTRRT